MTNIAIAGAAGRMGQALLAATQNAPDLKITGATERLHSPALGTRFGEATINVDVASATRDADVWIDFTTPAATLAALNALSPKTRAAIIGTTGLTPDDEAKVTKAAKRLAIVRSGNFSLGVNLLAGLVRRAAQTLGPD